MKIHESICFILLLLLPFKPLTPSSTSTYTPPLPTAITTLVVHKGTNNNIACGEATKFKDLVLFCFFLILMIKMKSKALFTVSDEREWLSSINQQTKSIDKDR